MTINRRQLLQSLGGASLYSLLPKPIYAQNSEKSALVVIHLRGGYNACFSSADSFRDGLFGVKEIRELDNGLVIDAMYGDTFSERVLGMMATVGVEHGVSGHILGRAEQYTHTTQRDKNPLLMIADAMGGEAAIKAAIIGGNGFYGPSIKFRETSFQNIQNLDVALEGMGVSLQNTTAPDRQAILAGLMAAKNSSAQLFKDNPKMLQQHIEGLDASIATLGKDVKSLPLDEVKARYGLRDSNIRSFESQLATAELMIRAGTNVIALSPSQNWDTHGDVSGARARGLMAELLPALKIFMERMVALAGYNVVTVITGEFARSLPNSNHAVSTATTVIGKYLKNGTTGRMDVSAGVNLKPTLNNSRTYLNYYALLSEALQCEEAIKHFGVNTHKALMR